MPDRKEEGLNVENVVVTQRTTSAHPLPARDYHRSDTQYRLSYCHDKFLLGMGFNRPIHNNKLNTC